MKSVCLLTLVSALAIPAIALDDPPSHPYFPMNDGAEWEYSLDMIMPFNSVATGRAVVRIDGLRTIKGKQYYKEISIISGVPGSETSYEFVRVGTDGVYAINGKYMEYGEYRIAHTHIAKESSWVINGPKGKKVCSATQPGEMHLIELSFENCIRITCEGKMKEMKVSYGLQETVDRCPKGRGKNNFPTRKPFEYARHLRRLALMCS